MALQAGERPGARRSRRTCAGSCRWARFAPRLADPPGRRPVRWIASFSSASASRSSLLRSRGNSRGCSEAEPFLPLSRAIYSEAASENAEIAEIAGFAIPEGKTFLIVRESGIGKSHRFSSEKLSPVLAIFRYSGFSRALEMVRRIYEVGGKGHSCGIYSFNDDHIHQLALAAPVSRIMVRQPQSKANAGAFNNGMPMTSSMGCGIWGGNITNENVSLKHYMQVTWVSHPIPEDKPSEQELFGEFYNSATF